MKYWIFALFLAGQASWAQLQFGPATNHHLAALDDIALVVNNEGITRRQLNKELAEARAHLPPNIPLAPSALHQQLMEQVIMMHLLNQLQAQPGVAPTEQEIDGAINDVAHNNGLTVAALYDKVQKETGADRVAYRRQIADTMAKERVKQLLLGDKKINISEQDIDAQMAQIQKQNNETFHLQDMLLPIPAGNPNQRGSVIAKQLVAVSKALKQSGGDLQRAATAIPSARFKDLGMVNIAKMPARFANAVSNLPSGQIVQKPVIDQDGLHFLKVVEKIGNSGGQAVIPEAYLSQIVLNAKNEYERAQQKVVADNIAAQLALGANFAEMARRYSQDGISAVQGGTMGWMSASQVDPVFAQQMLTVPLHQASAPFFSAGAWHIIKVDARRSVDRSNDLLRNQVRQRLYQQYVNDAWQKALQELRQRAYIRQN